ncbi:MAG: ATP-binding protein [Candidatus Eisenbacteria bacterium]|nr:ATP-binding protein [Candidatus Eisenbacteria bacterium]
MRSDIIVRMKFLDREPELSRLLSLSRRHQGGLVILWGRRRIGKTRLLLEWVRRSRGLYTVADQSSAAIQRRYFAESVGSVLPGFGEAAYSDWRTLLRALARQARQQNWPGPLVIDELPYLVATSPELPSVLQRFIDHEAREAQLCVALAGSSQHMMQGFQLDRSSPLFGRATEAFELLPLPAGHLARGLGLQGDASCVEAWAVWGGVPRYWELAAPFGRELAAAVDGLILDPAGPLHAEPDRLLVEEVPPATALRPLLDAVGAGAHRLSEIAGRIGVPATGLGRQLQRLQELGLLRREQPFGTTERGGKRSLYKIGDPLVRTWFRLVAPQRSALAVAGTAARRALWVRHRAALVVEAWEELCRGAVPHLSPDENGGSTTWQPARRYWQGKGPEWDVVSLSVDGSSLLLGEVKWSDRPVGRRELEQIGRELAAKGVPDEAWARGKSLCHVVFVPQVERGLRRRDTAPNAAVTAKQVLRVLR